MNLLYNFNNIIKGGSFSINKYGFPNLVKKEEKKKLYQYNIDNKLDQDKINIKQILIKRKEEKAPLISISSNYDEYNVIKKKEEFTTNINIKDIINL